MDAADRRNCVHRERIVDTYGQLIQVIGGEPKRRYRTVEEPARATRATDAPAGERTA